MSELYNTCTVVLCTYIVIDFLPVRTMVFSLIHIWFDVQSSYDILYKFIDVSCGEV